MTHVQRNFWLMLTGRSISKLGNTFTFLAMSLMIFAKTGSAMNVGTMMVATHLPVILLGPVIGVWVDRLNKRVTALVCELLRACIIFSVPFVPEVKYLYLLIFASAVVGFLSNTAQSSLAPSVFPKEELRGYNAKIQSVVQTMGIAGPVLAGMVIGFWSYTAAFIVDGMTFLISATTLMFLHVLPQERKAATGGEKSRFFAELAEGARYMVSQPRVMNATLMMFTTMIMGGMFNVLMIVFSKDVIRVTDQEFGWLEAGIGVGLALGAWLLNYGKHIDLMIFLRVALVFNGLLMVALGMVDSFYTELIVLVLIGVVSVVGITSAITILQTESDSAYIGRVLGFYDTVFMIGTVGSMAAAGIVASLFDLRDIFVYGGLMTSAVVVLLSLRRLPKTVDVDGGTKQVAS